MICSILGVHPLLDERTDPSPGRSVDKWKTRKRFLLQEVMCKQELFSSKLRAPSSTFTLSTGVLGLFYQQRGKKRMLIKSADDPGGTCISSPLCTEQDLTGGTNPAPHAPQSCPCWTRGGGSPSPWLGANEAPRPRAPAWGTVPVELQRLPSAISTASLSFILVLLRCRFSSDVLSLR